MKLKFEMHKSDLYEFYKFNEWYSPDKEFFRFRKRLHFGTLLFLLPFVSFIFSEPIFRNLFFISLGLFASGFFLTKYFMIFKIEKWVDKFLENRKNHDLIGERTMEFNEDNIQWSNLITEGKFSINQIEKILDDRHNYYIYLSSFSALFIPKRIFKTKYSALEFEDWINFTRSTSSSIKPFRRFE